jgi:hypothetical protein
MDKVEFANGVLVAQHDFSIRHDYAPAPSFNPAPESLELNEEEQQAVADRAAKALAELHADEVDDDQNKDDEKSTDLNPDGTAKIVLPPVEV